MRLYSNKKRYLVNILPIAHMENLNDSEMENLLKSLSQVPARLEPRELEKMGLPRDAKMTIGELLKLAQQESRLPGNRIIQKGLLSVAKKLLTEAEAVRNGKENAEVKIDRKVKAWMQENEAAPGKARRITLTRLVREENFDYDSVEDYFLKHGKEIEEHHSRLGLPPMPQERDRKK